jgi:hypothetical protein
MSAVKLEGGGCWRRLAVPAPAPPLRLPPPLWGRTLPMAALMLAGMSPAAPMLPLLLSLLWLEPPWKQGKPPNSTRLKVRGSRPGRPW